MGKDPESRDWKIDKFMSKYVAAFPDREPLTYEEVGVIIDEWDNRGRHITYPMAGDKWNQSEWQRARLARGLDQDLVEKWGSTRK